MGISVATITVVAVLALCGIIALVIVKKVKAQAYRGVVVNKGSDEIETMDDNSSTTFYLTLKLDDGKQLRIRVSRKVWK